MVDASKTSLENALVLFEERKAKYPQTRWTPPTCTDETPTDWMIAQFKTEPKPCAHKFEEHQPARPIGDAGAFGLKRGKDGAFRWPRTLPVREREIPEETLEFVAACAVLGLSFWSRHWAPKKLWAVDAEQNVHVVEIDQKARTAAHDCSSHYRIHHNDKNEPHFEETGQCERTWERVKYSTADGQTVLMEVITPPPMVNSQPAPSPPPDLHRPIKPSTPKAGFGGVLTAAEARTLVESRKQRAEEWEAHLAEVEQKAYNEAKAEWQDQIAAMDGPTTEEDDMPVATGMTMKAAVKMLHHDPDYLGDIPTDRLQKLLGLLAEKKYHPRIRRELKTRGVEPKG
jgi:hypothetical protein